jgi:hypothetical protein
MPGMSEEGPGKMVRIPVSHGERHGFDRASLFSEQLLGAVEFQRLEISQGTGLGFSLEEHFEGGGRNLQVFPQPLNGLRRIQVLFHPTDRQSETEMVIVERSFGLKMATELHIQECPQSIEGG